MHAMIFAGLALWGGIGWRLRGGAFTDMSGIDPGTQGARVLFGGLWFAAPMLWLTSDLRALVLVPALFLALVAEGWAGYDAVYHEPPGTRRRGGFDWILDHLGLQPSLWRNLIGLGLCGIWLAVLPALVCAWIVGIAHWQLTLILLWLGPWMAFAYWLTASVRLPHIPHFAVAPTEWAEFLVGAALLPLLYFSVGG
jgi:hypothetical protein